MTLFAWLQDTGTTRQEVAEYTGACRETVNRWVAGHAPSLQYLRRIRRMTKGAVLREDFLLANGNVVGGRKRPAHILHVDILDLIPKQPT